MYIESINCPLYAFIETWWNFSFNFRMNGGFCDRRTGQVHLSIFCVHIYGVMTTTSLTVRVYNSTSSAAARVKGRWIRNSGKWNRFLSIYYSLMYRMAQVYIYHPSRSPICATQRIYTQDGPNEIHHLYTQQMII